MQYQTKNTIQMYWRHSRQYPGLLLVSLGSVIFAVLSNLYKPFLYKDLFNLLVSTSSDRSITPFIPIIEKLALINVVIWIAWRIYSFVASYFCARVTSNLFNTCFEYVSNHSFSFFNNNFSGGLVSKINRFPSAYVSIFEQLFENFLPTFLNLATVLVVLYFLFPKICLIVSFWAVLYIALNYVFARFRLKSSIARAAGDTEVTGYLADMIGSNINLKLFGGRNFEVTIFKTLTEKVFRLQKKVWFLDAWSDTVQATLVLTLEIIIIWYFLTYWQKGNLSVGDFALLQAYLIQLFDHLWNIGRNIQRVYRNLADADEMTEILQKPHEIVDRIGATVMKVSEGVITFNQVDFGYNSDRTILKNFRLTIPAGEKLALIGTSGGGKSTIVKLLFRFLDIKKGEITIDGQNIVDVTQESLRSQIALVPQEPILFHRSLMENIRYARQTATDEEVIEAAKLAHCHEFISRFSEGYATFVGERGVKLSGGERQRVAIARAILKNAPILVLDEATSSLDSESERYIQQALQTLMKGKTTIVIAHRLSTIMQMDRIIVLEHGAITEEGKHEELMKAQQSTYQKLWNIQAGGFTS